MSNDYVVKFRPATKSNVASTLLPFWATMSNEILSFRQIEQIEHVQFVLTLSMNEMSLSKPATLLPKTATMSKQHSTLSKESFNL